MVYSFSLTIQGVDLLTDAAQRRLFDAGCGDATFSAQGEVQTADFDREATDFAEAVATAIKSIEEAVPGARVVEVHREQDLAAPS